MGPHVMCSLSDFLILLKVVKSVVVMCYESLLCLFFGHLRCP